MNAVNLKMVKDGLEIIYYVAFIILTWLIVRYARKTYILQSNKEFQLLCKVCVMEETLGASEFHYALEIYNYGNDVASQIDVVIEDEQVTSIDFIKPNESYIYPLGSVGQMLNCNRVWPNQGGELTRGTPIKVQLTANQKTYTFNMNTDLLYEYRGVAMGTLRDVTKAINDAGDKIKKLSDKLDNIATKIDVAAKRNETSLKLISRKLENDFNNTDTNT